MWRVCSVGLKMNLLDPTLAIDLQYLGVHLPIPPPTAPLEPVVQELRPGHGLCPDYLSALLSVTMVTQKSFFSVFPSVGGTFLLLHCLQVLVHRLCREQEKLQM